MENLLQLLPLDWRIHAMGEFHDASGWHCTIHYTLKGLQSGQLSVQGFGQTPLEAVKGAIQSATKRHPRHVMFRAVETEPQLPHGPNFRGRPAWDKRLSMRFYDNRDVSQVMPEGAE